MSRAEYFSFLPFAAGNGPARGGPVTGSAQLCFESRLECVCTAFSGKIRAHTFREMQEQALLLRQGYRASRLLINLSGLVVLDVQAQSWLIREWLPEAMQSGYDVQAVIMPHDAVASLLAHQILRAAQSAGMRVEAFPSVALAAGWLLQLGGTSPGTGSPD
jgi:hypothetical protein